MQKVERKKKKIAIVGLPNTGKSQVFNNLTGKYTLVGNYPFTTVDMVRTQCRIGNQDYEVIDTLGLHSLYIHSEEELIVRDMLLLEQPDVIIQCIDANRMKQSLTLTADLIELGLPMVISLNSIDVTMKKGMRIDSSELSKLLGIPVVESVTIDGVGTEALKDAIANASTGKWDIHYSDIIEDGIEVMETEFPEDFHFKRKVLLLFLLHDPFLADYLKKAYGEDMVAQLNKEDTRIRRQYRGNLNLMINKKRNQVIDDIVSTIVRKQTISLGGFSQTFAQLSRHPIWGIPILLMILFILYFLVVNVANVIALWMNSNLWVPIETQITSLVPIGFWKDFLIGDYGILTLGISNAILSVLPILTVFFILSGTLEDIGYIPNLCVLSKRFSEKIGLSGNAIMPITLGFGCKTMATLTTKSLRSRKEQYIAIFLIAFAIPCAPQMALKMSILGGLDVWAFVIAFSVLIFVEIAAGAVLNKIIKEDHKNTFIQALPDIRLPNPKAVLKKTHYRVWSFLKEAMPIFIYAAILLFVSDKIGILTVTKNLLRPVITGFLGFPIQMVDVLILSMAKHEVAAALIINLVQKGQLNYVQSIVAVTLTTMFVPCFSNIMAMIKELGARTAIPMVVIINVVSILIAGMMNYILLLFI